MRGTAKSEWGSPIQGETTGAAGKRSRSVGLDDVREEPWEVLATGYLKLNHTMHR